MWEESVLSFSHDVVYINNELSHKYVTVLLFLNSRCLIRIIETSILNNASASGLGCNKDEADMKFADATSPVESDSRRTQRRVKDFHLLLTEQGWRCDFPHNRFLTVVGSLISVSEVAAERATGRCS